MLTGPDEKYCQAGVFFMVMMDNDARTAFISAQ
jgi:hypothetical protein